jgi:hypothetical protein
LEVVVANDDPLQYKVTVPSREYVIDLSDEGKEG